jgi:hypothetical protein
VGFWEQPPAKQGVALKYRGERFAEVAFNPDDGRFLLTFRIPRESFAIPGLDRQLTIGALLKAVGLATAEVESWCLGDQGHDAMNGSSPEFQTVLALPPQGVVHLDIELLLKPPAQAPAETAINLVETQSSPSEVPAGMWEDLQARWRTILGLETSIETLRLSMESLRVEIEGSLKKSLTMEEKLNALRADLTHWTKEKKRALDCLPKVKDFLHRSVWAAGTPERKRLEALYEDHLEPRVPFPRMGEVLKELEALQKARQVLAAHGQTVYLESKAIVTGVHNALRTLQTNATANGQRKRSAAKGGKFFKDIRRATGG